MRMMAAVVVATGMLAGAAWAGETASSIEEGIALGMQGRRVNTANVGMVGFAVSISGPIGRANAAALVAKRKFQTVSPAEFAPGTDWTIIVSPTYPGLIAEDVLLLPKGVTDPAMAVRASEIVTDPVVWQNRYGAREEGAAISAVFTAESIGRLPAGDIDVVVVVPKGSTKGTLRSAARASIR